jgi:hypothetical protein
VKWGRIVSLAGALGLCASFFLPHFVFYVCFASDGKTPTVVIDVPVEGVTTGNGSSVEFGLPWFAAAVLLPVLAFRAVPRMDVAKSAGKFLAWAQCAICLFVLFIGLGSTIYEFAEWRRNSTGIPALAYPFPAAGVVVLTLAIISVVRSPLPRKVAAAQFALWAYYLAYFAILVVVDCTDPVFAGLWLSLAASGLLTIGAAVDWFQCRPQAA